MRFDFLVDIMSSILSSIIDIDDMIIRSLFRKKSFLRTEKKTKETISNKLEQLTNNLHDTSVLMAEIEAEFDKPKELAEKWKEEAENSKAIASLGKNEIEAIRKIFGGVLEEGEKKSSRRAWWWNLFFCLLGIVGGCLVTLLLK